MIGSMNAYNRLYKMTQAQSHKKIRNPEDAETTTHAPGYGQQEEEGRRMVAAGLKVTAACGKA